MHLHTILRRITYANVMSTIAVTALVAGGSAYAASALTTGKGIKDGSIQSVDIANGAKGVQGVDVKNGSLGAVDLSPAARKALAGRTGATGAQGGPGAIGATGARGISGWEKIPSGTTVVAPFIFDSSSEIGQMADFRYSVTLPGIASTALFSESINFAPAPGVADGDASCTGTVAAPTAPAGKVCLYLSAASPGTTVIQGGAADYLNNRAFAITWLDDGVAPDNYLRGTWAYTAA